MSRIVPSQVVMVLNRLFGVTGVAPKTPFEMQLDIGHSPHLATVIDLTDRIPPELITLDGIEITDYMTAIACIKNALHLWPARGQTYQILHAPGTIESPVSILLRTLILCPDDVPQPISTSLLFVSDMDLRDELRLDISTVASALHNGEWKPATVIAGSVVEALLLLALQNENAVDIQTAKTAAVSSGALQKSPDNDMLRWGLHDMIEVAAERNVLTAPSVKQCRIAKDFRNLIHPGRVQRERMRCTRGTAFAATAALEHVLDDFARKYSASPL